MAEETKEAVKEKKVEKRGKKIRKGKKHLSVSFYKFYKVEGSEIKRLKRHCPRCGPGTVLAAHKNREYCGKCGYTEFGKK
jgi:small subunit ribosomal protein S27Ae